MERRPPGLSPLKASLHIMKAVISAEIERERHEELRKEMRCLWWRTLTFWIVLGLTLGNLLTQALKPSGTLP